MTLVHRGKRAAAAPSGSWPMAGMPEWWRRWLDFEGEGEWLRVEEFADGNELVIRAELPDIDPEKDAEVTVGDGAVRIHAHREQKSEKKEKEGYRSEFRYGEFDREIGLPTDASADDVKATYECGILEVRVPCPATAGPEPKKVPVTRR
jgi:HSP20 family protein